VNGQRESNVKRTWSGWACESSS